jgi:hypothetical protein
MKTNTTNVKAVTSFMLGVFFLTISFKTFSSDEDINLTLKTKSIQPFIVSKGNRFDICNDVNDYINKNRKFYDSDPRELFSIQDGKFSKPKSKDETLERYIQISLQDMAYNPIQLTGYRTSWKNRIAFMEERMQQDFAVAELTVDINNDGITDRVLSYSYYNGEYKFWGHVNTVLDAKGNINLAFEKGQVTTGELFYYDGRTFSYRHHDQTNNIYEYLPSYKNMSESSVIPNNMNGLLDGPSICEINLKK